MKLGVVFPQTEIGNDPVALRDYAQAVEGLGYDYILTYDHVLGASTENRPGWSGYSSESQFHEPFVLFGYLAGCTRTLGFATGVLVLPQRQTALVAKQAAEVDILSNGRLRLGVGVGWNAVEYQGLNADFRTRGARMDEQVAVLRALWTEPVVTFQGQWHAIDAAGSVQKDVTFMEEAAPTIYDQIDASYRTKYRRYVANIISSVVTPAAQSPTIKRAPRSTTQLIERPPDFSAGNGHLARPAAGRAKPSVMSRYEVFAWRRESQ